MTPQGHSPHATKGTLSHPEAHPPQTRAARLPP